MFKEIFTEELDYYRMIVTYCSGKSKKEQPFDFLDIWMNLKNKDICKLQIQYGNGKVELGKSTVYEKKDDTWYCTQKNGKKTNQKVAPKGSGRNISIDNI